MAITNSITADFLISNQLFVRTRIEPMAAFGNVFVVVDGVLLLNLLLKTSIAYQLEVHYSEKEGYY